MSLEVIIITGMLFVICYLIHTMSQSKDEKTRSEGAKYSEWLLKGYGFLMFAGALIGVLALLFGLGKIILS